LKNSVDIFQNLVVPDADGAVAQGGEVLVAQKVGGAVCMLSAVDLDN